LFGTASLLEIQLSFINFSIKQLCCRVGRFGSFVWSLASEKCDFSEKCHICLWNDVLMFLHDKSSDLCPYILMFWNVSLLIYTDTAICVATCINDVQNVPIHELQFNWSFAWSLPSSSSIFLSTFLQKSRVKFINEKLAQ
jgi:hypothetical protein